MTSSDALVTSSFLLLIAMASNLIAFLLLIAMPGAPSSVLVTTSKALVTRSVALVSTSFLFLVIASLFRGGGTDVAALAGRRGFLTASAQRHILQRELVVVEVVVVVVVVVVACNIGLQPTSACCLFNSSKRGLPGEN